MFTHIPNDEYVAQQFLFECMERNLRTMTGLPEGGVFLKLQHHPRPEGMILFIDKQKTIMTQEEYNSTDWNRGNRVKLTNGKEYSVRKQKKRFLILYSEEYEAYFIADHHIIDCRTSDAIEPFEKKESHTAETNRVGECTPKSQPAKEEATPCKSAATVAEKPKRKRARIVVQRIEKVKF